MADLDKKQVTTPAAIAVELAVARLELTEDIESAPDLVALRVTTPVSLAVAVVMALVLRQTWPGLDALIANGLALCQAVKTATFQLVMDAERQQLLLISEQLLFIGIAQAVLCVEMSYRFACS
ncbi:hypothetical protein F1880_001656 [Penicillium rolfsii]|nr:hypothetical protein F1880_001656 [Penicillium rolfsii]